MCSFNDNNNMTNNNKKKFPLICNRTKTFFQLIFYLNESKTHHLSLFISYSTFTNLVSQFHTSLNNFVTYLYSAKHYLMYCVQCH